MRDFIPIQDLSQVAEVSLTEIFELLDQTARNLKRIQRQTFSQAGLTPPQYAVLHLLWERDGRPFKEFAEALVCTRATITGLIDTLERKGLVERRPNPNDRRSLLATLTEAGRKLQGETPSVSQMYDTCCTGLTSVEFQQLGFLLAKLNRSLIPPEV
jgi:DNA-binding MarR family transcriptional regulator